MLTGKSDGNVGRIYRIIEAHRHQHPVQVVCRVLGVAPSGYCEWLKHPISDRAQEYADIRSIWYSRKQCFRT
jgi:putative transposase